MKEIGRAAQPKLTKSERRERAKRQGQATPANAAEAVARAAGRAIGQQLRWTPAEGEALRQVLAGDVPRVVWGTETSEEAKAKESRIVDGVRRAQRAAAALQEGWYKEAKDEIARRAAEEHAWRWQGPVFGAWRRVAEEAEGEEGEEGEGASTAEGEGIRGRRQGLQPLAAPKRGRGRRMQPQEGWSIPRALAEYKRWEKRRSTEARGGNGTGEGVEEGEEDAHEPQQSGPVEVLAQQEHEGGGSNARGHGSQDGSIRTGRANTAHDQGDEMEQQSERQQRNASETQQKEPAGVYAQQRHEDGSSNARSHGNRDGNVHMESASTAQDRGGVAEQHGGSSRKSKGHSPGMVVQRQGCAWTSSSDEEAERATSTAMSGPGSDGTGREQHEEDVEMVDDSDGADSTAAAAQRHIAGGGETSLDDLPGETSLDDQSLRHARPKRARKQTAWHGVVPDPGPARKRKAPETAAGGGQRGKVARASPAQRRVDTAVATRSKGWRGTYMMRGAHGGSDLKYQIKLSPAAVARMEERDAFGDG